MAPTWERIAANAKSGQCTGVWSLPALQKHGHRKNGLHFGNEMLYC